MNKARQESIEYLSLSPPTMQMHLIEPEGISYQVHHPKRFDEKVHSLRTDPSPLLLNKERQGVQILSPMNLSHKALCPCRRRQGPKGDL